MACVCTSCATSGTKSAGIRYFTQGDRIGSATPYGDNPSTGHYVQAEGARLYYEDYGKGKPILVLHGGGVGSPYEMGEMIDDLRRDFRIIVMATRGHGHSEIGHVPFTYPQKAADAAAVLDAADVREPVVVLGFSDGAYTAYKLAALYPQRVERIAAIGAGTLKAGYFSPEMRVEDIEKADEAFVACLKKRMPEPERLQEFFTAYMGFWSQMFVGKETFEAIRCPVLFVAGDEDDHAPIDTMVEAFRLTQNSRLCIVPKAWHTCFLDDFATTWAAIGPFLRAPLASLKPSRKVLPSSSATK
ncbi:MAG: alpha/beta hydrolase [Lentisphaeria bacterium]|nr:alpha/beta hydrolase [Lentisphaeria bacterium]